MDQDYGTLLNQMRKDEEEGSKNGLRLSLLQGQRATQLKKLIPNDWKNALFENVGLKKSAWYDRVSVWSEFGPLVLIEDEVDPEYASITPGALKLLLKVCKGTSDNVKEEWLAEAASLSYSDLKKKVDDITGKEPHECGPFTETVAWKCAACGKISKKAPDGDIG